MSQVDRIPANWLRPTAGWRPGEFISDQYNLSIPKDLPPGDYYLYTGLYNPETLLRLPVFLGENQLPDERYQLPTISVLP